MQIPGVGELHKSGEDRWFAYKLPVGLALLLRLGLEPLLGGRGWLEFLVSCLLLAGAAWWAWRREGQLRGKDAPTALMSLGFWQALSISTLLTFGLVAILPNSVAMAYGRWQPLPMILGLWGGVFWLALGAAENRARHVYLGLWLCAVSALLPMISSTLWRMLIAAVALGGVTALNGWLAKRQLKQKS